jgi:uncharacterized membrane protein/cytochrome c556
MDAAHLHLLLNHAPVVGLLFASLLLAYGLAIRSDDVARASFWALGLVGLAAVVVYLTGEPAEELVEGLPGFSEAAMERHETAALWATWAAGAVGAAALAGLYVYRGARLPRRLGVLMLILAVVAMVPMGWTANLGGQVRHEEIRDSAASGEPAAEPAESPESPGSDQATTASAEAGADAREGRDQRQPIVVPEPARQTVLFEMRQMLEALNGVLEASAPPFDRRAVSEAALSGGTRIAVDMDPAMARRLPEAFVQLGSSTHEDFDDLARTVEEGASRDTVLSRLSALTAKCVSCHASYQLETSESPG